jgi:hypothetical protein
VRSVRAASLGRTCVEPPTGPLLQTLRRAAQQALARDDGAFVRAAADLAGGIVGNDIENEELAVPVAVAVTFAPIGVAAEWMMSTVTPTDISPSCNNGFRSRAPAISMRAIIRVVAKTAGNLSSAALPTSSALAQSDCWTTNAVVATAPTSGPPIGWTRPVASSVTPVSSRPLHRGPGPVPEARECASVAAPAQFRVRDWPRLRGLHCASWRSRHKARAR